MLWPGASRREENHDRAENEGDEGRRRGWVIQKGRHAVNLRGRSSRSQARHERNNRREY